MNDSADCTADSVAAVALARGDGGRLSSPGGRRSLHGPERATTMGGWRSLKILGFLLVLVLLGLGSLAWLERTTLLTWYRVRQLSRAGDADRAALAQAAADVGDLVLDGLLDCLHDDSPLVCRNARAGLSALVARWGGPSDARTTDLTQRLAQDFGRQSMPGQQQALELTAEWFATQAQGATASGLVLACSRLLAAAAVATDPGVQSAGVELCALIARQPHAGAAMSPVRDLVRACLQSSAAPVRLRAIQVGLLEGMDLAEAVATLLNDPAVEVRRAALVAVGPAERDVLDDTLLPCLRDPDPEVRRLCEKALKGRGLQPQHIELARLLTAPEPGQRLQVLDHLRRAGDLDLGVWLRRLSHDPAPSVRAAAIRVMSQQTAIDLTDRLDQMAQGDPSPTVSYLAAVYLKQARALQAEAGQ